MARISYTMVPVADVKCYYCGHISGQMFGPRTKPLKLSNFRPRRGYNGPPIGPGVKLRCERCKGPVFLEDSAPIAVKHRVDVEERKAA